MVQSGQATGLRSGIIEVKSENLKKNKIYNNVFDKYLNGHCEDLVNYLLLNNEDGEKIKIKGIFQEFDEDQIVIHYIYKLNDKYYDINGEFDTIEELTNEIWYIDFIDKIEYIDINKPLEKQTLEKFKNNELFNEIKNKLENEYLMEI
jgi:hypothetical protein